MYRFWSCSPVLKVRASRQPSTIVALALSALAWSPAAFAAPKDTAAPSTHSAAHGTTALRNRPAPSATPKKGTALPKLAAKQLPPMLKPKIAPKPPCLHESVQIMRGTEEDTFALTRCDGSAAPTAVEHLSILARPGNAVRPETPVAELMKGKGPNVAPGIRRVDPKLLERLQTIVDHFATHPHAIALEKPAIAGEKSVTKKEEPAKMARFQVISGYRPSSVGSYHASGRALDVRLEGISNEALVAFCKTLPDTGCGYYPNSSFMHIDVRDPGTGHVGWIDASGPGESPRYVASWPPPAVPAEKSPASDDALAKLDHELQQLPVDEHPSEVTKEDVKPTADAKETPDAKETADALPEPAADTELATTKETAPPAKSPVPPVLVKPLELKSEKN